MKNMKRVDSNLFEILSNERASEDSRKQALKDLEAKVSSILKTLESADYLFGTEEKSIYNDYCRNLAAFSLAASTDKKLSRVMLALEMLLENMAPDFKTELRTLKKSVKEGEFVVDSFGYCWDDLKLPFFANQFAQRFIATAISAVAKPQVVVVEKPVVVEKIVERVVEKPVIVEKQVFIEKPIEPKEDPDYFGVEDHYTEFKSSFVEVPGNAQYTNQRLEVCRKICAFLNADGGKLYIGVNPTTGKAYPVKEGNYYYGVARDMFWHLRNTTFCHAPINDIETYRRYVKREIHRIFDSCNDNVSLFINECIHVDPTKNNNVVVINVMPSRYCVVYLNGVAYQRDGEECKEMDEAQILVRKQNLKSISKEVRFEETLRKAIKEKRQATLYGYDSANSNTVGDRHVEPYEFVRNGEAILCYDLDKKAVRQFKLSRISSIRVNKESWKNEEKHEAAKTDIFDWTYMGAEYGICLDMTLKAMTFFCDMFANVQKDQFKSLGNGYWRIDTTVYSLDPVRGFFLFMANEVVIQETEDTGLLRKQIRDYVMEYVMQNNG
ncbi:MAG: putative DNA binding domain-containing protein [Bacteroidales bacterium]|nr:putative DNA binding domain-containing protein [Bacteroidales bacterium]